MIHKLVKRRWHGLIYWIAFTMHSVNKRRDISVFFSQSEISNKVYNYNFIGVGTWIHFILFYHWTEPNEFLCPVSSLNA